ncbi:MAG: DUF1801 domain-containing protein [Wenzhouxiangella sp.]|jgi:hypothetical protein|nr:DUF1801 domain-containing protein [Wenzhouxiangella sp.]
MGRKTVQALLDDMRLLGDRQVELVEAVRALVRKEIPSATEAVKYGGILFIADVFFAGVFAYKAHVSVEFSHGAEIDDRWGHLEGKGRFRRHVKLTSLDDLRDKRLGDYLVLALQAAESPREAPR